MKFKALLLSFLMLMPLLIVSPMLSTNIVEADVNGPVVWINPNETKLWSPCTVSSTFTVEVKLWNKKELTGVGVYAYDFVLVWPNSTMDEHCGRSRRSLFSLVSYSYVSPWDHYFVIKDESFASGDLFKGVYFEWMYNGEWVDGIHLAITALDNSTPLVEDQVVLLTLVFHVDCEPIWPDVYDGFFDFFNITLSDLPDPDTGEVTPLVPGDGIPEVDNGYFFIYSREPVVHLGPGEATVTDPLIWYCTGLNDFGHTVEFWISNMTKVYAFGFGIVFNYTIKYVDIQSLTFCDAFPPPYEYLSVHVEYDVPDDQLATLIVEMRRPCEKPPVTHQPGPAATIDFYEWFDPSGAGLGNYYTGYIAQIPTKSNTTITLEWAYVMSKCGCGSDVLVDRYDPYTYYYNWAGDFPLYVELANCTIWNFFRPCPGDLNLDGVVDIQDIQMLAAIYGKTVLSFPYTTDPLQFMGNLDGQDLGSGVDVVDIFDFVVVAKYFGKPCDPCTPESIADP